MADTGNLFGDTKTRTILIDTNLSGKENYFVTPDATDDNVMNIASAGTQMVFPLLEGKDGSSGGTKSGTIAYSGRAKILLGGTVEEGGMIMADGNGKGVAATDGKYYGAIALKAGVSGDIIECLVIQGVFKTVS